MQRPVKSPARCASPTVPPTTRSAPPSLISPRGWPDERDGPPRPRAHHHLRARSARNRCARRRADPARRGHGSHLSRPLRHPRQHQRGGRRRRRRRYRCELSFVGVSLLCRRTTAAPCGCRRPHPRRDRWLRAHAAGSRRTTRRGRTVRRLGDARAHRADDPRLGRARPARALGGTLPATKIQTRAALRRHLRALRRRGKRIVFTNGCFDLVHPGHVRYLRAARRLGEGLGVVLNSDASVRRLKGPSRALVPARDRAEVMAALEMVDYVTVFDEDTPYELIKAVQPDVLVKGGDWKPKDIVGADIVRARGGRVRSLKFAPGYSTTKLVGRIGRKVEDRKVKESKRRQSKG